MNYEELVGKRIRIVSMDDPYADRYIGKEGVVERASVRQPIRLILKKRKGYLQDSLFIL